MLQFLFFFQKALRTILSYIPCREDKQKSRLEADIKPVVDAIIIKCTDGNRFDYSLWWMWKRNDYFIFEKSQWCSFADHLLCLFFYFVEELVSCPCLHSLSWRKEAAGSWVWEVKSQVIKATSSICREKICFFLSRE